MPFIFVLDINRASPQRLAQLELVTTLLLRCLASPGAPGLPLVAPPLSQLLEDVEAAAEGGNERDDAGIRRLHFGLGHGAGGEGPPMRPCIMYVLIAPWQPR